MPEKCRAVPVRDWAERQVHADGGVVVWHTPHRTQPCNHLADSGQPLSWLGWRQQIGDPRVTMAKDQIAGRHSLSFPKNCVGSVLS